MAPTAVPPTASPAAGADTNVALKATISASGGADSATKGVDGDPNTLWGAGGPPPQWYLVTLDQPYLVDRLELVVAQTPAGQTSHEILFADATGAMQVYKTLTNTFTSDGQTLTVPITPPVVTNRVMIRTTGGPSYVAWREVRVFGQPPAAGARPGTITAAASRSAVNWPKLSLNGDEPDPVQVTNAGDGSGRLFVAERAGEIEIVKDGVPLAKPFLDISDRVKCCESEQGLFSIAFPPNYAKKGYFYVSYTTEPRGKFGPIGDTVVARYHLTKDPDIADPNSEEVILVIPQPNPAHNGGHLAFGPKDGDLYIGSGDGGVEGDPDNSAQKLDTLLGKILRIDTESGVKPYKIPPDNPFATRQGARPEIWALGFRNPWQFSFDSKTDDLYIGDVGENNYEEIDFQPAGSHGGENYGWPIMEGDQCHRAANCDVSGFTMPVTEYDHSQGCGVIGGQVYRGSAYPSLQGIYLYGDLCTGRIWGLKQVAGAWESNLLFQDSFSITNIGSDEQGELYLTDFTHGAILSIDVPTTTP
ncbi:MAG TPA: PQQ-dependent sugar dehydrogenase [Chloroflexota bacterium]|nr:PQQ-dependent sugar dehydrogenase [Chloroflexota bacterium]